MSKSMWTPTVGDRPYDRETGTAVEVMAVESDGVYVRPLRGGVERIVRPVELVPPDDAPGGFQDWQAERG